MRLWRAIGDTGYSLLFLTLIIGPLSKLLTRSNFLVSWRREIGIWFAIMAITHGILIVNEWANWDISKFFGYEFIPQLDRIARLEPGFGLAKTSGTNMEYLKKITNLLILDFELIQWILLMLIWITLEMIILD